MIRTQVKFVLGPAGCGKTNWALTHIRERLAEHPEGQPLLFLAPKQATYQIESQLLQEDRPAGFTRLQVLSFPRLAEYLLSELAPDQTEILNDDGRVMIVRSLINRLSHQLQAFRSIAPFHTFAEEISRLLVDFQRHQISEATLLRLEARSDLPAILRHKIGDLRVILSQYRQWLGQSLSKDPETLLDLATEQLSQTNPDSKPSSFLIEELWLEGFSEMTRQELDLLIAVLRHCRHANLIFCVDPDHMADPSWLNIWNSVAQTIQRCRNRLSAHPQITCEAIHFDRRSGENRFASTPALEHLEEGWNRPPPSPPPPLVPPKGIELIPCLTREQEVIQAARRIREYVRETPSRYRNVVIMVRRLEDYSDDFKRIFNRYQIPFFLDQREAVRHHPAIRLTHNLLRLVAYRWRTTDLMAALKTGLITSDQDVVDELENLAVTQGLDGSDWQRPPSVTESADDTLEALRHQVIRPLTRFEALLFPSSHPSSESIRGSQLVQAIQAFWESIDLQDQLLAWEAASTSSVDLTLQSPPALHAGVWEELQKWLDNVDLAFAEDHRPLRDWLPILEAGLSRLTVGIIPPTNDQVLIGSVDRTRTATIDYALVLGLNEGVFPAAPGSRSLLTEVEAELLGSSFEDLLPSSKRALANEHYFAYFACTRPRRKLTLTYAHQSPEGTPLNPSPLLCQMKHVLPLPTEVPLRSALPIAEAEHVSEFLQPLFNHLFARQQIPGWAHRIDLLSLDRIPLADECSPGPRTLTLNPTLATSLFGGSHATIHTSVSRLEQFAACPFRFFVHSGLRCEERIPFEIDPRRLGTFQHLVLETFHREVRSEDRNWRDVSAAEGRNRIERIGHELGERFDQGIFSDSEATRFLLESTIRRLQEFVGILLEWMTHYRFDPRASELQFGGPQPSIQPWVVTLEQGSLSFSGTIDRLDVGLDSEGDQVPVIVIDYKSSGRKLDPLLMRHGIQLQLLAYLNVVAHVPDIRKELQLKSLYPAGVFFVPLRGHSPRQPTRDRAQQSHWEDRPKAFQHIGAFDHSLLRQLDNRPDRQNGDQIQYRLKNDGQPVKQAWYVMPTEQFHATITETEASIRAMGNRILKGDVAIDPYAHGKTSACQYCLYSTVCRLDPAEHQFRTLVEPPPDVPSQQPT